MQRVTTATLQNECPAVSYFLLFSLIGFKESIFLSVIGFKESILLVLIRFNKSDLNNG